MSTTTDRPLAAESNGSAPDSPLYTASHSLGLPPHLISTTKASPVAIEPSTKHRGMSLRNRMLVTLLPTTLIPLLLGDIIGTHLLRTRTEQRVAVGGGHPSEPDSDYRRQ